MNNIIDYPQTCYYILKNDLNRVHKGTYHFDLTIVGLRNDEEVLFHSSSKKDAHEKLKEIRQKLQEELER